MDRVAALQMLEELYQRQGLIAQAARPLPPDLYEVVIVGAGIAGSALAHALGTAGRKVLIIERDWSEPDRIVGELLQPGGINCLKKLGIEQCLEGIDAPNIFGYAVFKDPPTGEQIPLKYPDLDGKGNPIGRSFHHGRFVMNLRKAAKAAPNVTCVAGTVNGLIEKDGVIKGVTYSVKAGADSRETKQANGLLTVICDGCNSAFRKNFVELKPEAASHFYGVVLKTENLPYPNHGHVILAKPAPILMYPISSTEVRMLIDIPKPVPTGEALMEFFRNVTAPQVPEPLRGVFLETIANADNVRSMPNAKLHPDPFIRLGVLCIGDTFNMRHPLTGGGMTVALNDVVIVRDLLARQPDLSNLTQVAQKWQSFYWRRYPLASTINILSLALYAVFAANNDPYMPYMREGCFAYFRLGGKCVSGPMSLLAGLRPSPSVLVTHFFAVALYGSLLIIRGKQGFPTPANLYKAVQVVISAAKVIVPLLYAEMVFRFRHPMPRGADKLTLRHEKERPPVTTSA